MLGKWDYVCGSPWANLSATLSSSCRQNHVGWGWWYSFARATITRDRSLSGLNTSNILSPSSGVRKSEIKVSGGKILSEGCEWWMVPGLSLCLVQGCLLPVSLHRYYPCVHVPLQSSLFFVGTLCLTLT